MDVYLTPTGMVCVSQTQIPIALACSRNVQGTISASGMRPGRVVCLSPHLLSCGKIS